MTMWVAQSVQQMRVHRHEMPGGLALVPTMGALHRGHARLMEVARTTGCPAVVSIFVNPTQFGPGEDYEQYPRQLERDLDLCRDAGAAGVFCPAVAEMYPPDVAECSVTVPALADQLEGRSRPGHFAGVCRVVAKLFNIVQPTVACFGQKDYQQLKVIQAMVDDLNVPVKIVAVPTVREDNGLAMSSRNVRLTPGGRKKALGLYKALLEARSLVEDDGELDPGAVEAAMSQAMTAHQVEVDYAVVRHPQSLATIQCIDPRLTGGVAALVAGKVDSVRLIDAMVLGQPATGG